MALFKPPDVQKLEKKRDVNRLIKALKNEQLCRAAIDALARIGDARAVKPLCEALKHDDWEVRKATAETLGLIGDARAVEPLCEALKDDNWEVRSAAAEALGLIGDDRAVEPLCAALKDTSMAALRAAESLSIIGGERALEILVACTKSENEYLRSRAMEMLAKRAGKQFGDADRWQQWLDEQKMGAGKPKEAEIIREVILSKILFTFEHNALLNHEFLVRPRPHAPTFVPRWLSRL